MDEVKNVRAERLGDTQSRELHEDVDNLLLLRESSDAVNIGISEERITIPL